MNSKDMQEQLQLNNQDTKVHGDPFFPNEPTTSKLHTHTAQQSQEAVKFNKGDPLLQAHESSLKHGLYELVLDIRPPVNAPEWNPESIKSFIYNKCKFAGVNWGSAKEKNVVYDVNGLRIMCVFDAAVTSQTQIIDALRSDVWCQSIEVVALNKVD
jgi:translation elongation factor EF-1beta